MNLLSQFHIVKQLGNQKKRKFGEVFLIQNKISNEFFILKKLIKNKQNIHLQKRLISESKFNFTEQSLPKVLHFEESNTELFLILAYKKGIPLDEYWNNIKRVNRTKEFKEIVLLLIPAFELLDQKKIVHGDLKPSNILIDKSSDCTEISIIDFGMAFEIPYNENRNTIFNLAYSSPELILNKLHIADHTSDIYSLGLIFWTLFNGKLPFYHSNPSIYTNIQINLPIPESKRIPKELYLILSKMCTKHSFSKPPNRLTSNEVDCFLNQSKKSRFQTLIEVSQKLTELKIQEKSKINQLIKFFSKPKIKGN